MDDFDTITIIGVGLIGGSLGLAIKSLSNPPRVIGVSRREKTIAKALEVGAIDQGLTSIADAVKDADLVFIATPLNAIVGTIKKIVPLLKPGTIITDVGSAKSSIIESVEQFLPDNLCFIGGHPMAGSEQQGVSFASPTLFKNSFYLLTPTKHTNTADFRSLHSLLTSIGAQVLAVDPEKHDKIVSTLSHLPHIISATLVNLAGRQTKESKNLLLIAAGGFRDMTRIAASNPDMWRDICMENSEAILGSLEEFTKSLAVFKKNIQESNDKKLWEKFKEAQSIRKDLPKILHKDISELRELSIPVIDKPGVISDITVTIGRLGINIRDIEIVHMTDYSGVLRLVVNGDKEARTAAKALRELGCEVEVSMFYDRENP